MPPEALPDPPRVPPRGPEIGPSGPKIAPRGPKIALLILSGSGGFGGPGGGFGGFLLGSRSSGLPLLLLPPSSHQNHHQGHPKLPEPLRINRLTLLLLLPGFTRFC